MWPNMAVLWGDSLAVAVVQPRGFLRCEMLTLPFRSDGVRPRPEGDPLAAFRQCVEALHGTGRG